NHRDSAAEPDDAPGGDEKLAASRPQVVDSQVDGANVWEMPWRRRLGFAGERRLAGERGQGDCETAHHVERRRDNPTMQNLTDRIADQFGPHIKSQSRRLGIERVDLETEHAVEWDHLFEG